MPYNRNIPQPTDLISNSQPQILGNFQTIDSGVTGTGVGFSRNHITMTNATNGGLHNRVDYYQAVASPAIVGFVSSLYPKTVSAIGELFYKNGTADIQITSSSLTAASGQGFLPGGLQIRSGVMNANGAGLPNAITPAFPTACIGVTIVGGNAALPSNLLKVTAIAAGSFTAQSFNASTGGAGSGEAGYYIAIGY